MEEKKKCPHCNVEKHRNEYYSCSSRKDGLQTYCKVCKKTKFKESKKLSDKKYQQKYFSNPENVQNRKEYNKIYQSENIEKQYGYSKKHRKTEKYKINRKKWRKKEYDSKYGIDVEFTLKLILRNRLKNAVLNEFKKGKTLDMLGCSIEYLKQHLESQFNHNMNWNNYGKGKYWEIDHIKPCDAFDLNLKEEQNKCFHYTNLQPLPILENRSKSNKY